MGLCPSTEALRLLEAYLNSGQVLMWWLGKQSDDKQLLFINFIEGVLDDGWVDCEGDGAVFADTEKPVIS